MDKLENQIIETGEKFKNGQKFCPNCGSTQMYCDAQTGKLKCKICESTFDGNKYTQSDIRMLNKNIIGSGARNINEKFNDCVTIKCNGCGAEVTINTKEATHKKCHWCGGILSINERIENGTVPDVILPFKVTKKQALEEIEKFMKGKKAYAQRKFKENIKLENITGVYLPYMLIDANTRCYFEGVAERDIASYYVQHIWHKSLRYDLDVYELKRIFDLEIEDLTIETSKDKLSKNKKNKTNNIINAIMPFDTKNCIEFESNYLTNFRSEKRDINIDEIKLKVETEIKDIARYKLNKTILDYNRGIRWRKEKIKIKGMRWISAYLPVWIYSYYDKRKKKIYYIAVNGRTKKTAGSVPLDRLKMLLIFTGITIISSLAMFYLTDTYPHFASPQMALLVLFALAIRYYKQKIKEYKNIEARYEYEKETETVFTTFVKEDNHIDRRRKQKNYEIEGRNNNRVDGDNVEIEYEKGKEI